MENSDFFIKLADTPQIKQQNTQPAANKAAAPKQEQESYNLRMAPGVINGAKTAPSPDYVDGWWDAFQQDIGRQADKYANGDPAKRRQYLDDLRKSKPHYFDIQKAREFTTSRYNELNDQYYEQKPSWYNPKRWNPFRDPRNKDWAPDKGLGDDPFENAARLAASTSRGVGVNSEDWKNANKRLANRDAAAYLASQTVERAPVIGPVADVAAKLFGYRTYTDMALGGKKKGEYAPTQLADAAGKHWSNAYGEDKGSQLERGLRLGGFGISATENIPYILALRGKGIGQTPSQGIFAKPFNAIAGSGAGQKFAGWMNTGIGRYINRFSAGGSAADVLRDAGSVFDLGGDNPTVGQAAKTTGSVLRGAGGVVENVTAMATPGMGPVNSLLSPRGLAWLAYGETTSNAANTARHFMPWAYASDPDTAGTVQNTYSMPFGKALSTLDSVAQNSIPAYGAFRTGANAMPVVEQQAQEAASGNQALLDNLNVGVQQARSLQEQADALDAEAASMVNDVAGANGDIDAPELQNAVAAKKRQADELRQQASKIEQESRDSNPIPRQLVGDEVSRALDQASDMNRRTAILQEYAKGEKPAADTDLETGFAALSPDKRHDYEYKVDTKRARTGYLPSQESMAGYTADEQTAILTAYGTARVIQGATGNGTKEYNDAVKAVDDEGTYDYKGWNLGKKYDAGVNKRTAALMRTDRRFREAAIGIASRMFSDTMSGDMSGNSSPAFEPGSVQSVIWNEMTEDERVRAASAGVSRLTPESTMNMISSSGNQPDSIVNATEKAIQLRLSRDGEYANGMIGGVNRMLESGDAAKDVPVDRVLSFMEGLDYDAAAKDMDTGDLRNVLGVLLSKNVGGTELTEEQSKRMDALRGKIAPKLEGVIKRRLSEDPLGTLPLAAAFYSYSKGWNGMAEYAQDPFKFYGTLALLLVGGVFIGRGLFKGLAEDGRDPSEKRMADDAGVSPLFLQMDVNRRRELMGRI